MFDRYSYKTIGKNVANKLMNVIFPMSLIIILLAGGLISVQVSNSYNYDLSDGFNLYRGDQIGILKILWFSIPMAVEVASVLGIIFALITLFSKPLTYGEKAFYLYVLSYNPGREAEPGTGICFNNTKKYYAKYLLTEIIMDIKIILWSLLLIIPGIVKSCSYFLVPFIVVQYPDIQISEAQALSEQYMKGRKWDLFVMCFSFIGWEILNGLTAGILGVIWLRGYEQAAFTAFYKSLNIDPYHTYSDTKTSDSNF